MHEHLDLDPSKHAKKKTKIFVPTNLNVQHYYREHNI